MEYRIWTGNGQGVDGQVCDSISEAEAAIRSEFGWDDMVVVEGCDGGQLYCYRDQESADEDECGAYAPSITLVDDDEPDEPT